MAKDSKNNPHDKKPDTIPLTREIEKIQSPHERPQEEEISDSEFREEYEHLLKRLSERERDVYEGREIEKTDVEIGKEFQLTGSRIGQIAEKAKKSFNIRL